MLNHFPRPAVIAHRGASMYAPENTLAAFDLALQQDADAIELDVKLSADEQIVVIHDNTVDRTTNGTGEIRSMPLNEIKKLDAGSHFNSQFCDEKIPTLQEVFWEFGRDIFINIEITNYASPTDQLPLKVAELVNKNGLQEMVFFSSFNPLALIKINNYLPGSPKGLLVGTGLLGLFRYSWLRKFIPHQALHSAIDITSIELIKNVHEDGKRIHVFTVNSANDIKKLLSMEVDGFFTDDPPLGRKLVNSLLNSADKGYKPEN